MKNFLSGKCKNDFNNWCFDKYKIDNNTSEYNLFVNYLFEEWLNSLNVYIIPNPIVGPKNGYDSFPIIGWRCDILMTNKNTTNSFYLGYPIQDWFVYESLDKGDDFSDINIDVSENLKLAKEFSFNKFNEIYNSKF